MNLDYTKATDTDLLERFSTGRDELAFAELVRRHYGVVTRSASLVLDDEHDVEDATQVAFLALAKKAHRLRTDSWVAGWLFGASHRSAQKIKRKAIRENAKVLAMREFVDRGRDDEKRPDEKLERWEKEKLVHEAIYRLPAKLMDVVVRCYMEGCTEKEAAKELGIPTSTVHDRKMRGLKALQSDLLKRGVTFGTGGLAGCVHLDGGTTFAATQGVASELARKAVLFAAGRSAEEIGVSQTVLNLSKSVGASMKTATVLLVGVGLLAAVFVWVVANRPIASQFSSPPAVLLMEDEFDVDSLAANSGWQIFGEAGLRGTADVSSGELILTANPNTRDRERAGLAVAKPIPSANVSIRVQTRITAVGGGTIINARTDFKPEPFGYFAALGFNPRAGGTGIMVGRVDGLGRIETFEYVDGKRPLRGFDIRKKDAILQLDVIGDRVRAWVWEAGKEMPKAPFVDKFDDTYREPAMAGMALQNGSDGMADIRVSKSIFRWVKIANVPIHELPTESSDQGE